MVILIAVTNALDGALTHATCYVVTVESIVQVVVVTAIANVYNFSIPGQN